jgi:hypothetical protein
VVVQVQVQAQVTRMGGWELRLLVLEGLEEGVVRAVIVERAPDAVVTRNENGSRSQHAMGVIRVGW